MKPVNKPGVAAYRHGGFIVHVLVLGRLWQMGPFARLEEAQRAYRDATAAHG